MSRATGQSAYFMPLRLTPSQTKSSPGRYPAFHWTPSLPSEMPRTPRDGLAEVPSAASEDVSEETLQGVGGVSGDGHGGITCMISETVYRICHRQSSSLSLRAGECRLLPGRHPKALHPGPPARSVSRKRLACGADLSTLDGSTSARMAKLADPLSYRPLLVFRVARAKPFRTSALAICSILGFEGSEFSWNFGP